MFQPSQQNTRNSNGRTKQLARMLLGGHRQTSKNGLDSCDILIRAFVLTSISNWHFLRSTSFPVIFQRNFAHPELPVIYGQLIKNRTFGIRCSLLETNKHDGRKANCFSPSFGHGTHDRNVKMRAPSSLRWAKEISFVLSSDARKKSPEGFIDELNGRNLKKKKKRETRTRNTKKNKN